MQKSETYDAKARDLRCKSQRLTMEKSVAYEPQLNHKPLKKSNIDGSIGYYSSEGEAGRLAESMDDLFSLLVSCICWHDCCDTKQYVDSKTLEEYGQRQRNCNLEDMDMDSWRRVSDALGIPADEPLAPVLERFRKATQRQPLYQCIFHEDDGSLTESYGLMFE